MDHTTLHPTGQTSAHFQQVVESAAGSVWRPGNAVTILQNGDQIFPAMLGAIRSAKHSIDFLSYVFWRSDIATEFTRALSERARSGVRVRLLVDAVGGATMSSRAIWQLERAGVHVGWYHPGRWQYLRLLNNRTHRKLLICDNTIGFTGGVGIADEWTGTAQDSHHFRETHCQIEGPAVLDLFEGFADNWPDPITPILTLPEAAGHTTVHTTISRATDRPTKAQKLYESIVAAAQHRLWITSAYFVPNAAMQLSLSQAAERGVDVRILTNGDRSNHHITTAAGRATYARLLVSGVKIYEYDRTMHHGKIATADGAWATIGSTNLDARSLVLNDELNVSVVEPRIVGQLDTAFLDDLSHAKLIRPTAWHSRRPTSKLAQTAASLLASQL